jgi:hypothetical protein
VCAGEAERMKDTEGWREGGMEGEREGGGGMCVRQERRAGGRVQREGGREGLKEREEGACVRENEEEANVWGAICVRRGGECAHVRALTKPQTLKERER